MAEAFEFSIYAVGIAVLWLALIGLLVLMKEMLWPR